MESEKRTLIIIGNKEVRKSFSTVKNIFEENGWVVNEFDTVFTARGFINNNESLINLMVVYPEEKPKDKQYISDFEAWDNAPRTLWYSQFEISKIPCGTYVNTNTMSAEEIFSWAIDITENRL